MLGYKEYTELESRYSDLVEIDEQICQMCVLDPIIEDWEDYIYAGYCSTLGQAIREESLITPKEDGSTDLKRMIAEGSEKVSSQFLHQIPLVIKHCFQEYTIDAIEKMSLRKQIDLYVKALWMLDNFENIKMDFEEE